MTLQSRKIVFITTNIMEVLIKLNTQTAGRDKLARLLQYVSRLLWHRLKITNYNGVHNLKNVEFQLSTFRKRMQTTHNEYADHTENALISVLRFGRCVDCLYSALPLFQIDNATIKHTVILSKIANALFLFADHVLWLGRVDVLSVDTTKWARISNKYWLYSITMNLMRDFYEISHILRHNRSKIVPKNIATFQQCLALGHRTFECMRADKAVMIDTVKNMCDFFIPLTALGHVKLSPSAVGVLGIISSIAGLMVLVEPNNKLMPQ